MNNLPSQETQRKSSLLYTLSIGSLVVLLGSGLLYFVVQYTYTSLTQSVPLALAKQALNESQSPVHETTNVSQDKAFVKSQQEREPTLAASPTPSSTPTPATHDCVGPDGKHFMATEQDCLALHKAWGK